MKFNKAIVISLEKSTSRRARIKEQNINHEFFDAIDGDKLTPEQVRKNTTKKGYIDCLNNQQKVFLGAGGIINKKHLGLILSWCEIVNNIDEPSIVMEDDAVACEDFYKKLNKVYQYIPISADLIYLSWNLFKWRHDNPLKNRSIFTEINEHVSKVKNSIHGTGAIIVNPKCKKSFLSILPAQQAVDHEIPKKLIKTKRVNAYTLTYFGERLVVNDNLGGSTISSKI